MGKLLRAILPTAVLGLFLSTVCAQVWPYTFTAKLSSDSLANPVETEGSATAVAVLTGNQLVVTGVYQNLSSPITGNPETFFGVHPSGANIRLASHDGDGPVAKLTADQGDLVPLTRTMTMLPTGGASGTFSGAFILSDEQLEDLKNERYFVQLYTEYNRTGELRGQLTSEVQFDIDVEGAAGIYDLSNLDYHQWYADGTWSYLDTLEEVGETPRPGYLWSLDKGIHTLIIPEDNSCAGTYVGYLVHTKHDTTYYVSLETDGTCSSPGSRIFSRRTNP